MKILIDIGHPAHVHLFKNFAWIMQKKGHEIFFTCREKEFEIYLLEKYAFQYKSFGKKYNSKAGKLWGMLEFDVKEFLSGLKFKPDIFLSHGSIYAAHAAFLLNKPHIALEDTGNWEQIRLYLPFSSAVLAPQSLTAKLGGKEIKYPGYHELAYLHPGIFKADNSVLNYLNIEEQKKYVILRFVSWEASHDIGQSGLDNDTKRKLIKFFNDNGYTVFISSEKTLPQEFEKYNIKIPPEKMLDALFFASLFIGEGATMANECALLGTPALYINSRKACIGDLVSQRLMYHYKTSTDVMDKVTELIKKKDLKNVWNQRLKDILQNRINLTDFLVWFVDNYPNAINIAKNADEKFWKQFQ